jgi:glyoxylase-like metal-dependent hydrolase (beta-lactamase superfamily II)
MGLGYRSQTRRAASLYAVFDALFDRDLAAGRCGDPGDRLDAMLDELQRYLQAKIDALVSQMKIV